jgi:DNA (cytosine-5)-methyltransferase 1
MSYKLTFGSVCSGIEASQLAFVPFGFEQLWCSEIAEFPSKVLNYHYPNIPNMGDMINLPKFILDRKIEAPDLFCGGTPCQAFSLAGWKNGLADKRGQLTITFIEIANAIDKIRQQDKKSPAIILWENVEGVLNDKTNAFGNFIAGLAGFDDELKVSKWAKSGYLEGANRNIAWRVIDAKHFGLPQQRKRLYVLAGGKDFRPDQILFEFDSQDILKKINQNKKQNVSSDILNLFSQNISTIEIKNENIFYKENIKFEIFREYTDCLYAAYGTKWNGNAAAYNGSLYVAQNDKIRRFTPLECERLMGFPDNYTLIDGHSDTNRYQAIGNSWAIPVVKWIGKKIYSFLNSKHQTEIISWYKATKKTPNNLNANLFLLDNMLLISSDLYLNTSSIPNMPIQNKINDILQLENVSKKFYLSPQACKGILRRKSEKKLKMNQQLEKLMTIISEETTLEIAHKSKQQQV